LRVWSPTRRGRWGGLAGRPQPPRPRHKGLAAALRAGERLPRRAGGPAGLRGRREGRGEVSLPLPAVPDEGLVGARGLCSALAMSAPCIFHPPTALSSLGRGTSSQPPCRGSFPAPWSSWRRPTSPTQRDRVMEWLQIWRLLCGALIVQASRGQTPRAQHPAPRPSPGCCAPPAAAPLLLAQPTLQLARSW